MESAESTLRQSSQLRSRRACTRCRRQKLKCDNQRPCLLCLHSNVSCEDQPVNKRKPRRANTRRTLMPPPQRPINTTSPPTEGPNELASSDPEEAPVPESNERSWKAPTSTLNLVQQVFRNHRSDSCQTADLDAIPDSWPPRSDFLSSTEGLKRVSDVLGMKLPSLIIVDLLVTSYLRSMTWYHSFFHEPSLWSKLQSILRSGYVSDAQTPFLLLLTMVLVTGGRYVRPEDVKRHAPAVDLTQMLDEMMQRIEERLLVLYDTNTVESVTALVLLSTHYLFNRRPRRAFIMAAAALRAAQAMGLYNELFWGNIDPIERELRRRLWWTLYTVDGFVAQVFGRPALIDAADINVKFPLDVADNSAKFPSFQSLELREDGSKQSVTVQSYHRHKAALYLIAAPITRDMYGYGGNIKKDLAQRVKEIHHQLLDWERNLPPELRLKSHPPRKIDPEKDQILQTFRLQAMALQVSYDNIQLLLHRPLLECVGRQYSLNRSQMRPDSIATQNALKEAGSEADMARVSKNQCWQSAMRTSLIGEEHPDILQVARKTPFGAHVGIHSFTAGVMLGIIALSHSLSNQAQEAKRGIARIIRMRNTSGYKAAVWNQSAGILEELLRLILAEEMKKMVSSVHTGDGGPSMFMSSTERSTKMSKSQLPSGVNTEDFSHHTTNFGDHTPTQGDLGNSSTPSFARQVDGRTLVDQTVEMEPELEFPDFSFTDPDLSTFMSPDGNFDNALLSLQQVFSGALPNSTFGAAGMDSSEPAPHISTSVPAINQNLFEKPTGTYLDAQSDVDSVFYDVTSRGFDPFETGGQIWMWRPQPSSR